MNEYSPNHFKIYDYVISESHTLMGLVRIAPKGFKFSYLVWDPPIARVTFLKIHPSEEDIKQLEFDYEIQ